MRLGRRCCTFFLRIVLADRVTSVLAAVCGSAAGIIASISKDEATATKLLTEEPHLLHALAPLLMDTMTIQMRSDSPPTHAASVVHKPRYVVLFLSPLSPAYFSASRGSRRLPRRIRALRALASLARGPVLALMHGVPGLHRDFMSILRLQSLDLLPPAADYAVKYVTDVRLCALTMQHEGVLMSLLRTSQVADRVLCCTAMRVIESLVLSIETARSVAASKARPVKDAGGKGGKRNEHDENVSTAEQIKQITSNSYALITLCRMIGGRHAQCHAILVGDSLVTECNVFELRRSMPLQTALRKRADAFAYD